MTQVTLPNGQHHTRASNGVNGVVGKGKAAVVSAPPPDDVQDYYEIDVKPPYLDGYTFEDIVNFRPISDPYDGAILPPFARRIPIDVSSFRTGYLPTPQDFSSEIHQTFEGQIPFAEILDRVVQDAYGNLNELAEVMPSFSDLERKTRLIQYAVSTRKQIIKVYAISKWARVADDVQKALNILSFLSRSEQKVTLTRNILGSTAAVLIPAKRRNADIITALDVLYSGAYRRLPSVLRETFEDYKTITDEQVVTTLNQLNDAILYRLRLHEIVPVPMSQYRVCDGRAWFTAPGLFEVALTVTGPEETDYWYALDMKFLVEADGNDADAVADFPSDPHPWLKGQIISNLNEQLALNSDLDLDIGDPFEEAPRRKLRDPSKIDTPLVRAYNMLQTLSLSYELEILYQQAMRQLKLGWQDVMTVVMEPNRKSFVVEYWRRQPQAGPSLVSQPREGHPAMRPETAPLLGGTLTFSIVSNASTSSSSSSSSASQPHVANVLSLLEQKIKSAGEQMTQTRTPTDSEEPMQLRVEWKPIMTALAIPVLQADMDLDLRVDPSKVDFNALMRSVTRTHSQAILRAVHLQLVKPGQKTVFSSEDVELTEDNDTWGCALRIRLCPSQTALLSVDPRTGKITMKDIGVFAAANRSGKFLSVVKYVNKFPGLLVGVIRVLKFETIFFELEQQARYLGLHATKNINVPPAELIKKFGRIYTSLYIRLAPFPTYYLVALITDEEIKWALVNVKDVVTGNYPMLAIDDFGWLEAPRIGGASERQRRWSALAERSVGPLGAEDAQAAPPRHHLSIEPEILRELYAFCCARVSHTKIEQQLKTRKIPYSSVFTNAAEGEAAEHEAVNASSLTPFCATAQSVPKICIRIGDLVRSEAVTNVAYENVKIKVVDWWSERPCRVITSVRLRDIQPVSDLSLGSGSGRGQILDASRNITYDPVTSIVSFISYDVNTCVEEFLGEWERVQRAAGIVREVGHTRRKRRWSDIQILSFNLQRVELVYHSIYAVAIQWIHPSLSAMATNGLYEMDFKVIGAPDNADGNPHQDIAGFLCRQLQSDATRSMSTAVEGLILVLRDSLPILLALQKVKRDRPGRVNLFVKSASRYRLLYGLKHAVDFRILPHSQVIVSDAATLIAARPAAERATAIFERIPSFDEMCGAILRQVGPPPLGSSMPPVLQVGSGLVCSTTTIGNVISKLHSALSARFWSS